MIKHLFATLILACLTFAGCVEKPQQQPDLPVQPGTLMLIANEGNFQWGNAALSLWHLDSQYMISEDVFRSRNNRPLGDVLQHATLLYNNEIALVVNNSSKIEFIHSKLLKSTATLTGLNSPRYICNPSTNPNLALVSELYQDSLSVIDILNKTIIRKIYLKGWTENMLPVAKGIMVCNRQSQSIYLLNHQMTSVIDSIRVGLGSKKAVIDHNQNTWIICTGDETIGVKPQLVKLSAGLQVLQTYQLPAYGLEDIAWDEHTKTLFVLTQKSVHLINPDQGPDWSSPLINDPEAIFYAMGIYQNKIFVSDAIDYVQRGLVKQFNYNGNLELQFNAGRIPNGFLFLPH